MSARMHEIVPRLRRNIKHPLAQIEHRRLDTYWGQREWGGIPKYASSVGERPDRGGTRRGDREAVREASYPVIACDPRRG